MALPKFRFHLSTAILLMFAAGGLIGLNVNQRFVILGMMNSGEYHAESCYGFPFSAWVEKGDLIYMHITESHFRQVMAIESKDNQERSQFVRAAGIFWRRSPGEYSLSGIIINTLLALGILFVIALISEYIIYRKSIHSAFWPKHSALR